MKVIETALAGVLILEPEVYGDDRGFFLESWNAREFADAGIDADFVQDNHSRSAAGVLRGLHFQNPRPQGKLVRVVAGAAWDVAVDLRRASPTYGKWAAVELSAANRLMFWVPVGLAHGFLSLADDTDVLYKCTDYYDPAAQQSLKWDDPAVAVDWPLAGRAPQLSARDREGTPFDAIEAFA